ncbi:MAG: DUF3052 domain-containing protein [Pseudomonadota bacterium]
MPGYSNRPLAGKLGIKDGTRGAVLKPPEGFLQAIDADRRGLEVCDSIDQLAGADYDYLHQFVYWREDLASAVPRLRPLLCKPGMLWISWPKRAARVPTDVTEDVVREIALAHQMVDIKVCAVDEVWSALKLVIPVALRGRR